MAMCTSTNVHVGCDSSCGTAALCHALPWPGKAQHRFLGEANFPLCSGLSKTLGFVFLVGFYFVVLLHLKLLFKANGLHTKLGWWGQGQKQITLRLKAADGSVETCDAPHRAQKAGVPLNLFLGWSRAALLQQRYGK